MASIGTVSVGSTTKSENIDLNGGMTLGAVLAHFLRCSERELEGKLSGQVVRLGNSSMSIPDGLTTPLRDRDFVSIYPAEVARGGVKGAQS